MNFEIWWRKHCRENKFDELPPRVMQDLERSCRAAWAQSYVWTVAKDVESEVYSKLQVLTIHKTMGEDRVLSIKQQAEQKLNDLTDSLGLPPLEVNIDLAPLAAKGPHVKVIHRREQT